MVFFNMLFGIVFFFLISHYKVFNLPFIVLIEFWLAVITEKVPFFPLNWLSWKSYWILLFRIDYICQNFFVSRPDVMSKSDLHLRFNSTVHWRWQQLRFRIGLLRPLQFVRVLRWASDFDSWYNSPTHLIPPTHPPQFSRPYTFHVLRKSESLLSSMWTWRWTYILDLALKYNLM